MQIEETQSNPNHRKKEGPRTYQGLAAYHRHCAAQIRPRRRRKTAAPLVREDRCSRLMAPCACGQGHRRGATRRRRPHPPVGALASEGAAAVPHLPPAATGGCHSVLVSMCAVRRGADRGERRKNSSSGLPDHGKAKERRPDHRPDRAARRQEVTGGAAGLEPRKKGEIMAARVTGVRTGHRVLFPRG